MANQLFWKNHLNQETTALPKAPDPQGPSRLASLGQRSISAPSSLETDLRKYMPAGQRVQARGAMCVDQDTGTVGLNQGSDQGVWSLVIPPQSASH